MHKSKLIDFLKTLTEKEIKALAKYLKYSEASARPALVALYSYVNRFYPEFESPKLEKEVVFKKVFGASGGFKAKKMRDTMSELSGFVEAFLMKHALDNDAIKRQLLQLDIFEKRKLDKYFFQTASKLDAQLNKRPERDIFYHQQLFLKDFLVYQHPATEKIATGIDSFQNAEKNLDLFYLIQKLKYAFEKISRGSTFKEETRLTNLSPLLEEVNAQNNPVIRIYKRLIDTYRDDAFDQYEALTGLVFEHHYLFSELDRFDIYVSLSNFCVKAIHSGKGEFLRKLFELYKNGLANGVWPEKGKIFDVTYMSMVTTSCSLEEFGWAKTFINDYARYLGEAERESLRSLCLAYMYFSQDAFDSALESLMVTEYSNVYNAALARSIQMMCYYELDAYALSLFDYLKSFSEFIRRNKVMGNDYKLAIQKTISLCRKLHKNKIDKTYSKTTLLEELKASHAITNRKWLNKKILEMD